MTLQMTLHNLILPLVGLITSHILKSVRTPFPISVSGNSIFAVIQIKTKQNKTHLQVILGSSVLLIPDL